jgi:hypothetical protein
MPKTHSDDFGVSYHDASMPTILPNLVHDLLYDLLYDQSQCYLRVVFWIAIH